MSTQQALTLRGAAPAPAPAADNESCQHLVFTLNGESFAIGILHIKEIIEYGRLTEVPMMPALLRGVINLRGAVVPVIDLSVRLGRAPTTLGRRTCIVILEVEAEEQQHTLGVIVDAVSEVLDIPGTDIDPPPSFGTRIRADFIRGMGKLNSGFVIILDVDYVLSINEIAALGELPAAAGTLAA